jgi:DNA-binding NarL/FixJ family response regulator
MAIANISRPEPRDTQVTVAATVSDDFLARRIAAVAAADPALHGADMSDAQVVVLSDDAASAEVAEQIQAAKRERADVRVLVISQTGSAGRCRRLLDHGADGVVLGHALETGLASAIVAVAAGHIVQPRSLMPARGETALSHREKQVLGLVVMGFTNREVAKQLFLAECTVKSHMQSIFAKLGVGSRKEAVAVLLDPQRGLGLGVLALTEQGGKPPTPPTTTTRSPGEKSP